MIHTNLETSTVIANSPIFWIVETLPKLDSPNQYNCHHTGEKRETFTANEDDNVNTKQILCGVHEFSISVLIVYTKAKAGERAIRAPIHRQAFYKYISVVPNDYVSTSAKKESHGHIQTYKWKWAKMERKRKGEGERERRGGGRGEGASQSTCDHEC